MENAAEWIARAHFVREVPHGYPAASVEETLKASPAESKLLQGKKDKSMNVGPADMVPVAFEPQANGLRHEAHLCASAQVKERRLVPGRQRFLGRRGIVPGLQACGELHVATELYYSRRLYEVLM